MVLISVTQFDQNLFIPQTIFMSEAVDLQNNEDKKFDILLVSPNPIYDERVESFAKIYGYSHCKIKVIEDVAETLANILVNFVILDAAPAQDQNDVVGYLQVLRYIFPKTPLLVVCPKRFDKDILQWIRKSGANFIMSENEFLERVRFDFFASQYIGSEYLPVKPHDFKLDSKVSLSLFYYMSANRRYYPIVAANTVVNSARFEKIKKIGDVYIRRTDLERYHNYLQENQDQSANGLIRRCRSQFHEFKESYLNLVNHLTEETEIVSYEEGKRQMEQCQKLSRDLVSAMMSAGSVFDVISQSVQGSFHFCDRAPERAAMVGYLSMMGDVGNPEHAILATLLCDIGLLNLPRECLDIIRKGGVAALDGELRKIYEQHPQFSINCAAQKKLQIDPVVREAILHSHSRINGTGFPRVRAEKVNAEAQLIQVVEFLDDLCQVQWGKPRLNYKDEFKRLLKDPSTWSFLSPTIVQALKGIDS